MRDFKKELIPYPSIVNDMGGSRQIGETSVPHFKVIVDSLNGEADEAVALIMKDICDKAAIIDESTESDAYPIYVKIDSSDKYFEECGRADAYYIEIDENKAVLCGYDFGGVYYAAVTFCQLLYSEYEKLYIPLVKIIDYPSFPDRGLYIECRYGVDFMTLKDWKEAIDYFSKMKYNNLTIGVYGCWGIEYDTRRVENLFIPIKKYPKLVTPRNIKYYSAMQRKWIYKENAIPMMFKEDFFGELIAYAKKKNIKVKPLFNSLGHNTLLPRMYPEISAKDAEGKDTGFGYCTTCEKTYEIMFNIYDEIIERYLAPNGIDSIEIGMDEVLEAAGIDKNNMKKLFSPFCQCSKCRTSENTIDLIINYIIRLCRYLKSKGMKNVYIYHDMLFDKHNLINDDLVDRFKKADIYDVVVFDWWSYDINEKLFWGKSNEVNSKFRSVIKPMTGYFNWAIPTENNANIRECTRIAYEKGFEGVEAYSSFEYCYDLNYMYNAELSWNINMLDKYEDFKERYSYKNYGKQSSKAKEAIDSILSCMTNDRYRNNIMRIYEYYFYAGFRVAEEYPRNFPGLVFKKIYENSEENLKYLSDIKHKAQAALSFFDSDGVLAPINDNWRLTALQYYVLSDEYITLCSFKPKDSNDEIDVFYILSELERLVDSREKLMKLAEKVRPEYNQYIFLRNMSIIHQYLFDLLNYVKKCVSTGEKIVIDLENLKYTNSNAFYFIR